MSHTAGIADKVLANLEAQIGNASGFGMTVHRRVENVPRIGLVVADDNPGVGQHRQGDPRRAVVPIVEQADLPWSRKCGIALQPGREAVERDDQPRPMVDDPRGNGIVVGTMEPRNPRSWIDTVIAGNDMTVTDQRHQTGMILLAIKVDDEARHAGQDRRSGQSFRQRAGERLGADIDGDMAFEQRRIDAEIDIDGHMVGRMIDDQQQSARDLARHKDGMSIMRGSGDRHASLLQIGRGTATTRRVSSPQIDRRTLIGGSLAAAILPLAPGWAQEAAPPSLLDNIADRLLVHFRETATHHGVAGAIDGGALARQLDDLSPAGEAARRAALATEAKLLATVRIGDPVMAGHAAIVASILANGTRSAAVPYGRINPFWFSGHVPYLLTPVAGPHIDRLTLLESKQSVATPAAIDAWLARLDDFEPAMAGVVETLRANEADGCRPPRVLLEKTQPILAGFLQGKARDHRLIRTFAARLAEAGVSPAVRDRALRRARTALDRRARPGFRKLQAQVAAMLPTAREEAGVWAQADGAALYAANVRSLGDTPLAPSEIHALGLEEVARITAAMEALLARRGLTRGSVGARMNALGRDPANQFAGTDAGRAECLAYVEGLARAAEARYPDLIPASLIPKTRLVIRRAPAATEAGAPTGFYSSPSLDGTRPGAFTINLADMNAVPRFALPSIAYHEGVPGHHLQGAVAAGLAEAPLLVRIASFNAYQEGWALYAEALMAELGAYREDPLGDLGRLQGELFRAVRLVVDTGLHHERWSRERAIAYMAETTGSAEAEVTREIERYMAWPGQALGYKIGHLRLHQMRDTLKAKRGRRFDLKAFHATVLSGGAMPLDLLEARILA